MHARYLSICTTGCIIARCSVQLEHCKFVCIALCCRMISDGEKTNFSHDSYANKSVAPKIAAEAALMVACLSVHETPPLLAKKYESRRSTCVDTFADL